MNLIVSYVKSGIHGRFDGNETVISGFVGDASATEAYSSCVYVILLCRVRSYL